MKIVYLSLIFGIICILYTTTFPITAAEIEVRDKEGRLVFNSDENQNNNRLEIGASGNPILISFAFLSVIGTICYKLRTKSLIQKFFKFILNFEISKSMSIILVISLIFIFIIFNIDKIWNPQESGDYSTFLAAITNYSPKINDFLVFQANFRYLIDWISYHYLGNVRIIPFIESVSLLIVTYYTTVLMSKKRFAGILSLVIMIQSNLFQRYSVVATEDNAWTLFYLLSLCVLYKRWYVSPISYILSLISKPLVAIFLPMTLFFVYQSSMPKNLKLKTYFLYLCIAIIFIIAVFLGRATIGIPEFNSNEFLLGFKALGPILRFDPFVLIFLLPLVVGLFLTSRRGIPQADSAMVLIAGVSLSASLLMGLVNITNQEYRFIPLLVFFAIGIGILFSKKTEITTERTRHISFIIFITTFSIVLFSIIFAIFPSLI